MIQQLVLGTSEGEPPRLAASLSFLRVLFSLLAAPIVQHLKARKHSFATTKSVGKADFGLMMPGWSSLNPEAVATECSLACTDVISRRAMA